MDRQHPSTEIRPPSGRPLDADKHEDFVQLCEYLDTNDECQYSSAKIFDIYKGYCGKFDGYSPRWLTLKLKDHYGDGLIVTSLAGQTKIYSFRDAGHKILYDKWKSKGKEILSDKSAIIVMVASFIRDDIRTSIYYCSKYPILDNLADLNTVIPESLNHLLSGIIKTKSANSSNTCNQRRTAISHSILSSCRQRSFVSPLMLSIAVYIHRKYASCELIDILSSLSFCETYREIQKLNSA